jgi:hypothetical protein
MTVGFMGFTNAIAALLLLAFTAGTVAGQTNTQTFSFPDGGGVSKTSSGVSPDLRAGYARLTETTNYASGLALFGLRQGNVLVSEVTVPVTNAINGGRIYAEYGAGVDTVIAIANTSNNPNPIAWYFTDSTGTQTSSGVITIAPHAKISQFLREPPFNLVVGFQGTFTFFTLLELPEQTIAAIALRGFVNERGDFLMTVLPIIPLSASLLLSNGTIPHFASGDGWATQLVLVNPTDADLGGTATFINENGAPAVVATERGSSATFDFRVAPRSSWTLKTLSRDALNVGSIKLSPAPDAIVLPIGFLIFSFAPLGVTIVTAGVPPSVAASDSHIFVEGAAPHGQGQPGWIETGIAISNVDSSSAARVALDLFTLSGVPSGLRGFLDVPAGGHISRFLNEIPGFESLPAEFQGVLKVSGSVPVTTMGLRSRYNERNEFLTTTLPVASENDEYFGSVARYATFAFPHVVDGGGYSTQFALFSGWSPGPVSGTFEFFQSTGAPLPLVIQ